MLQPWLTGWRHRSQSGGLEATGRYETIVAAGFPGRGLRVIIANPAQVRICKRHR